MTWNRTKPWILSLFVVLQIGTAEARLGTESARFRRHNEQAVEYYSSQNYEGAIREWETAYRIRQMPILLYNLGQAHRRIGHYEQALDFYRQYLRREQSPPTGIKDELSQLIVDLEGRIREASALRSQEPQPPERAPEGGAAAPLPPPQGPRQAQLELTPTVDAGASAREPGAPERTPVHKKWWFWTALAGGVVVGTVAIAAGVAASRSDPCASITCH